jgi:peptidoglycan/xylan/chitin deacetylase (PgdA/CDA1 family)
VLATLVCALPASATAGPTVVSLTFDDGWGDQATAIPILQAHGMRGTFFINSSSVGAGNRLSWAQLEAIDAAGQEIAGHTLDHLDLTTMPEAEARRQVCDDRANLVARGFVTRSFAYPFGEYNTTVKTIVRDCGYASGRGAFGLRNITATNDSRPYAGPIPPPDPYAVLTPCCINSTTTLSALQNYIIQAENGGGGWVPFVLHRICDGCGDTEAPSMSPATLQAFLDWLQPRAAQGTVVQTVAQVITGDVQSPTSSIACGGTACSAGWYGGPVSVSLAAMDAGSGVAATRYTLDSSEPTASSTVYSGPFTVSATTTVKFRAWDNASNIEATNAQTIQIDMQPPSVVITSPAEGSTVNGNVKIMANATDAPSGIAQVSFYVNGTLLGTKTSAPYFVSWNTKKLAAGEYTLVAVAQDAAGNMTASPPVQVRK